MEDSRKATLIKDAIVRATNSGAKAAKIWLNQHDRIECSFEAGKPKSSSSSQSQSYSIEVLVAGHLGRAHGNDLGALNEMVDRAIALAQTGSVAHFSDYPAPPQYTRVASYCDKVAALCASDLFDPANQIVEQIKAADPDVFITANASRSIGSGMLFTSAGTHYEYRNTLWNLDGFAQRTEGTDMLFAGSGRNWRAINNYFRPAAISDVIVQDLRNGRQIVDPPRGKVRVFFPPDALVGIVWPLFLGTDGKNILKGESPLKDKLNQQILHENITIIDDPHAPYATDCGEIDSDGVPARQTVIFDRGVLKSFLYDWDTAHQADASPTGNNGCHPWSPTLIPGDKTEEQLLDAIGDGLYIKFLMGYGQGNIINGDFSANIGLGFRVRDGRIVGRVKNTMVAGNLYEVLARPVLVGRDLDPTYRCPSIVIDGVNVTAGK